MRLTSEGIAEIKRHEGLRLKAYPDPGSRDGNPWTIGYGHTSLAGEPRVYKGMTITRDEADEIFERDIQKFADGVRPHIKVRLNDNQFSAFVSFAYNVGVGNFSRSSALRMANAGKFDLVPARLALWNKNDGKVMRGLVNRRAAEGRLFMKPVDLAGAQADDDDLPEITNRVEPSVGKPLTKSKTAGASIATGAAGVAVAVKEIAAPAREAISQAKDAATEITGLWGSLGSALPWIALGVIVCGVAFLLWDRARHAREDGV